jgi:hypothetical protein
MYKMCTFSNVATGAATAGSAVVSVQSTQDNPSTAVSSGALLGFAGVTFVMTTAQRAAKVAASAAAVVTVGFQRASVETAAGADPITITFPSNFFLTSSPTVVCTGGTGLTATVAFSGTTMFVLTTTTTAWDTTAKSCTFSNVATGVATVGSLGVTVQSAIDSISNPAVGSGVIGGQVCGVTFAMTTAQRKASVVAASSTAVVTVGFARASVEASAGADPITINFPPSFFLTSVPTVSCTGGTGLTATVAFSGTTMFVLTTTTTAWDTTAKVCTFSNVATGGATAGSMMVTVQSAVDSVSAPVSSGALLGPVTAFSSLTMAYNAVGSPVRPVLVYYTCSHRPLQFSLPPPAQSL